MELFTLVAKFVADTKGFVNGVGKAKDTMDKGRSAGEKLEKTLGKLKTAFAAVVSVAAIKRVADGLMGLAKAAATAGDRVDKQSQALGMSRKAYQEWDYILGQSGASIDSMGVSMKTLNAAILSGSKEAAEALDSIGLSAKSLSGMSQEQAFETVVKAFQRLPSSAKKSADAVKLFGRNGQELMPLLNTTTEGMDALRQEANALGLVMSDSMIDSGVKFGDSLDRMSKTAQGLKNVLGYGLQEGLTNIFDKVTQFMGQQETQDAIARFSLFLNRLGNTTADNVSSVFDWLITHSKDITDVLGSIIGFFNDIIGFISENGEIAVRIGMLIAIAGGFMTPLRAILIIVGMIAANWGKIKTAVGLAKDAVVGFFSEKIEQGKDAISKAVEAIKAGFEVLKTIPGEALKAINDFLNGGGIENADLPPWVKGVLYVIRDGFNFITKAVNRAKNWVKEFLENLNFNLPPWVSNVVDKITGAFQSVYDTVSAAIGAVKSFFGLTDGASIEAPEAITGQDWNSVARGRTSTGEATREQVTGKKFATGLNRVPWDNFPARLHKGEAVLTRTEAEQWRSGGAQTVDAAAIGQAVASAVAQALSGMGVIMDGQQVGRLTAQTVGRELERASRAGRFAPA